MLCSRLDKAGRGRRGSSRNAWLLDPFLFLLERVEGHAFKSLSILAMIHDIIHGSACYFLSSETERRVWADETLVGVSKVSSIFSKDQGKKMDND